MEPITVTSRDLAFLEMGIAGRPKDDSVTRSDTQLESCTCKNGY